MGDLTNDLLLNINTSLQEIKQDIGTVMQMSKQHDIDTAAIKKQMENLDHRMTVVERYLSNQKGFVAGLSAAITTVVILAKYAIALLFAK